MTFELTPEQKKRCDPKRIRWLIKTDEERLNNRFLNTYMIEEIESLKNLLEEVEEEIESLKNLLEEVEGRR